MAREVTSPLQENSLRAQKGVRIALETTCKLHQQNISLTEILEDLGSDSSNNTDLQIVQFIAERNLEDSFEWVGACAPF